MPGSSAAPIVKLLRLSGFPLLRQLWLEEGLFRSHPGHWFVINDGVPDPTIVLGISGCVSMVIFFSFYCLLAFPSSSNLTPYKHSRSANTSKSIPNLTECSKPEELINLKEASTANIPLLRRFTGGGTVIVDSNSIMTSIIMHGPTAVPDVPCYPRPIMHWTEGVFGKYLKQFNKNFTLRENGTQKKKKKKKGIRPPLSLSLFSPVF